MSLFFSSFEHAVHSSFSSYLVAFVNFSIVGVIEVGMDSNAGRKL